MNKNFRLWGGALAVALMASSCVGDGFGRDRWDVPNLECNNKYDIANISLEKFVALAPPTGTVTIKEDYIIDGYVISSDENGGFYKSIVFQDSPENPKVGLQLEVDRGQNYAKFPVGTQIRINAKGLVLGKDRGVVKLGIADPNFTIGRIPESQLERYIAKVCINGQANVAKIKPIELNSLAYAQNERYINQLVSVSGVQFSDVEVLGMDGVKTYVNQSPKTDTNRELVDANGRTAVLRTPQSATFGADNLPMGSGKITFVVNRFNTNYQLVVRNSSDIDFSSPRMDAAPAKGGTSINYLGAGHLEEFTSYPTGATSEEFVAYINDPVVGNRYWRVNSHLSNKFLQFSYGTGAKPYAKTRFAIPVDFDRMTGFSFTSKDGYNTDNSKGVLKVYYSTDYTRDSINATLVDITEHFTISNAGTPTTYAANFINSGIWLKPTDITGQGFIIFEYQGGGSRPTTTIQIDGIRIH